MELDWVERSLWNTTAMTDSAVIYIPVRDFSPFHPANCIFFVLRFSPQRQRQIHHSSLVVPFGVGILHTLRFTCKITFGTFLCNISDNIFHIAKDTLILLFNDSEQQNAGNNRRHAIH